MIARRALHLRALLFLPQHKPFLHEQEALEPELQRQLRTIDPQMDRWRDNLRMWMSAVVLQPLAQLFEANEKLVQQAAAKGIAAPAAAGAPAGAPAGGMFGAIGASPYANLGGTFAPTAQPLFGPKPAAALPGVPAPGQAMTVPQWLQHAHADDKSKALKHQHGKLRRFTAAWQELRGFSAESAAYVQRRIRELADDHCVRGYKWDGGGAEWNSSLPMDSEVLVHVFATFFDMILSSPGAQAPAPAPAGPVGLPPAPGAAAAAPAPALGGGGMFGGSAPFGAPSSSRFSGPAQPAPKTSVFWRSAGEAIGFSSRHLWPVRLPQLDFSSGAQGWFTPDLGDWSECQALGFIPRHLGPARLPQLDFSSGAQRRTTPDLTSVRGKSDVIILRKDDISTSRRILSPLGSAASDVTSGASGGAGATRAPPRYSLLCDNKEWVVARGEHNAWEVLVLFLLQRAKRAASLGAVPPSDLRQEVFGNFETAMTGAEGAAKIQRPDVPTVSFGPLYILHPWSEALEELSLEDVHAKLP